MRPLSPRCVVASLKRRATAQRGVGTRNLASNKGATARIPQDIDGTYGCERRNKGATSCDRQMTGAPSHATGGRLARSLPLAAHPRSTHPCPPQHPRLLAPDRHRPALGAMVKSYDPLRPRRRRDVGATAGRGSSRRSEICRRYGVRSRVLRRWIRHDPTILRTSWDPLGRPYDATNLDEWIAKQRAGDADRAERRADA
jgi:hypothetical protein